MLTHHLAIGLKTTSGEDDRVRSQYLVCVISRNFQTGVCVFGQKRFGGVAI